MDVHHSRYRVGSRKKAPALTMVLLIGPYMGAKLISEFLQKKTISKGTTFSKNVFTIKRILIVASK